MFTSKHYIPILKWKRAEQTALKLLEKKHRKTITPLIQVVMPKQTPIDTLESITSRFKSKVSDIPKTVCAVWGNEPIFLDVSLVFTTKLRTESLLSIARLGQRLGGRIIPVIYLSDDYPLKEAALAVAKENNSGLCLRLTCSDLDQIEKSGKDISELLSRHSLNESQIDLIVDVKEVETGDGKYEKYFELAQRLPNLLKWRTFTYAAGSFPENLSKCNFDEENIIPRVEWKSWKENTQNKRLKRRPSFGDYTIQYPIYKESTQFYHPTTSIKYALDEAWLILKGKKKQFDLYLANAQLLARDIRYCGQEFSFGDKYIADKGEHFSVYIKNPGIKGTGSTENWIMAGINHHLALAAYQISNLP